MLLTVLLGIAIWIAVALPFALLFAGSARLREAEPEASGSGDVQFERVNLTLAVGAGLDRAGGADQIAHSR
jgi:hypothetical protein